MFCSLAFGLAFLEVGLDWLTWNWVFEPIVEGCVWGPRLEQRRWAAKCELLSHSKMDINTEVWA